MRGDRGPGGATDEAAIARRVGGLLRQRREQCGLSREDVARMLRFGTRHVAAVEEGRFDELPHPPYARGLVSAYASLVGLDGGELLRVGEAALSAGGRPTRLFRYPGRERFNWREWTAPLAFGVAALAIVVARATLVPSPEEIPAPPAAPPVEARAAPAVAPPVETPPVGAAAAAPAAAAETAPLSGVRVLLRSEGNTWIEAAADGAEPRRTDFGPGQNLELAARERITLALGDAGVVRVAVNGRELGFIGDRGEQRIGVSFTAPKTAPARPAAAADGD